APSLVGVGSRLDEGWMTHWIQNPHKIRPSSRMPALVDSIEDAAHISRYLAELKMDRPKHPTPVGNAIKGGALFAELGCISCHSITKENAREDADRLSLLGVGAKFLPGALAGFLRAPGQHYPWTRMPDFKLLPAEAADLAAFLRDLAQLLPRVATISGDLVKGKELFVARNCAACHESPIKDTRKAPNFSTLAENTEKGCMANAPEGPRFGFSLTERQELTSFLRTGGKSLHQHNLQEFASRQFNELRCMACHERDGEDSQWDSFAEEVGAWKYKESDPAVVEDHPERAHRANSTPPSLTFAGEKLHREWTSSFLAGKIKGKPRPWMLGRMPAFPRRSELLAEGLARACGISKQEPGAEALKEPEMMKKIGAQIANVLCLTCHGIGSRPPIAVFEGQGINLLLSRQRLRKEYYLRWMLNPYRINPATIMPKFADEEGRTGFIDILEGDAKNQFDAIWRHLDALPTE
ncbi:MAG: c-type cytochrome, partial [Opitutales bacterium]